MGLKERIHAARFPLPPWGVRVMKVVYFSIPVVFGYWLMTWVQQRAAEHTADREATTRARLEAEALATNEGSAERARLAKFDAGIERARSSAAGDQGRLMDILQARAQAHEAARRDAVER